MSRKHAFWKKIQKELEQGHMLVFTPLLIVNDSETLPSYLTVAFMLMWKDFTMLKMLGGQPIFYNIANSNSLLIRSKTLVKSMKAIYKGTVCSLHLSCSCRREKIMSVMKRSDLNHHCDSGYTLTANVCRRGRIIRVKVLPAIPSGEVSLWSF